VYRKSCNPAHGPFFRAGSHLDCGVISNITTGITLSSGTGSICQARRPARDAVTSFPGNQPAGRTFSGGKDMMCVSMTGQRIGNTAEDALMVDQGQFAGLSQSKEYDKMHFIFQ
jgi:hypothetical protein